MVFPDEFEVWTIKFKAYLSVWSSLYLGLIQQCSPLLWNSQLNEPFIFMNKKPIVWKLQRIKKWSPSYLGVGMYSFGTNSMIKNSMPFRTLWFHEGLSIFVSKKPSTFFGFCGKVGTVGYISSSWNHKKFLRIYLRL